MAALEIRAPGAAASIQDLGRFGYRRLGVPCSGALAPDLLRIANRLVGNAEGHAAIECFDGGQVLRAENAPVRLAVAGDAALEIELDGLRRPLAAWRSFVLDPGATLRIRAITDGRVAMLAIAGLNVAPVLGSTSCHARSGLGGKMLAPGDRLLANAATALAEQVLPDPPCSSHAPLRVLPGPQQDCFDAATLEQFLATEYRVGDAADRMGMRLEGSLLQHLETAGHEIVSDAIVPGAIQVPGHGLPIVLLADAQTAGGYPKIATVISADLGRLGTRRPGDAVRFIAVDAATAETAAREHETMLRARLDGIRTLPPDGPDLDALYSANLVGGVIDALAPPDTAKS